MSRETTYTVFVRIPYEGEHDAFWGTLTELMEWLRGDKDGYSIDDMTVYENTNLNLYDLAQEC